MVWMGFYMHISEALRSLIAVRLKYSMVLPTIISTQTTIQGGCLKKAAWVPDEVLTIDGSLYLGLSYQDRGLARYCGIDCSVSHPLSSFRFIDDLRGLRNTKVSEAKATRDAKMYAEAGEPVDDDVIAFVNLKLPAISYGEEKADETELKVISEPKPNKIVFFELTAKNLDYIRLAMLSSRDLRKRKHSRTDVQEPGVHYNAQRGSLYCKILDHDCREHKIFRKVYTKQKTTQPTKQHILTKQSTLACFAF